MSLCPCGSDRPYEECCEPYIEGREPAPTAEALMRSRYTAHTLGKYDYLNDTVHPSIRDEADHEEMKKWSEAVEWDGLEIFSTTDGAIYHVLTQIFGANAPDLLSDPKLFPALIVGQNIWKETGYGTIIYLAALSSVDVQLYEAAKIDGAGRWQLMWHVTLPAIRGTIVLMLIMKVGQLLNTSYEQIFLMQNSMNRAASDVFDTYVYTKGITGGQYSLATATGLFKSTISMLMVVTANKIAKLCGESGLY